MAVIVTVAVTVGHTLLTVVTVGHTLFHFPEDRGSDISRFLSSRPDGLVYLYGPSGFGRKCVSLEGPCLRGLRYRHAL